MDKITINELKHYLDTDLKIQVINPAEDRKGRIASLKGLHYTQKQRLTIQTDNGSFYDWELMPLVYPLSMLTQEIEHNGEMIVPIVELAKIAFPLDEWKSNSRVAISYVINFGFDDNSFWAYNFASDKNITIYDQFKLFQKLFAMHFDVFNWIGRGLAIDKSTLNK